MFQTFRNAVKMPDLRKKLLYTLLILIIFRIGTAIPVPFLDLEAVKSLADNSNGFLSFANTITGGALASGTIFAMSITPYINSSIIVQLLTVAIPVLERWQKEGEEGRKRLAKMTRYITVGLALLQGFGYYTILKNQYDAVEYTSGFPMVFSAIVIIAALTAGTALIVWLGERINDKGIGNGISIILFAGILSRGPDALLTLITLWKQGSKEYQYYILVPLIVVLFLAMIVFIVIITNAERRIPVQYAKRVVGRKMYGGQSTHIPIKVNMSGVMPIIFASSFLTLPSIVAMFMDMSKHPTLSRVFNWFSPGHWVYAILYFVLIIGFNYFYVAIQYNPIEIANNLRKNNGGIPGVRPGEPTTAFISKVISKITLLGAIFLGIIAIFPTLLTIFTSNRVNIALGGTSILIVVGVALETMRQMESQMTMRHHKGFLE